MPTIRRATHIVSLLSVVTVLAFGAAISCSDNHGPASDTSAGYAGGWNVGGWTGTGGTTAGGRPTIPDPPITGSLSALEFTYDGGRCTTSCKSISCSCKPFTKSFVGCHPERGCLTAVNCTVACEMDLGNVVRSDGVLGSTCHTNSDCKSARCGKPYASASEGTCTDGSIGSTCSSADECASGLACAVGSFGGKCTSGQSGEPCADNAPCDIGTCAQGLFESFCTSGGLGEACEDNRQCVSGHCVRTYDGDGPTNTCTDGSVGTPCDNGDDADCAGGRCAQDMAGAGWTCSAGARGRSPQ